MIDLNSSMAIWEMQSAFDISLHAAAARLDFFDPDSYRMRPEYHEYFSNYNINFGYYCHACKSAEIEGSKFCKICGVEANPYNKTHNRIFYLGFDLNQDKKTTICPQCGNAEFSPGSDYCRFCGTERFNWCTACDQANDGNARWCVKCGSTTIFAKENFLKNTNRAINLRGVDPMKYNDGVEMNSELRIIRCPQCGNEEFSDNAKHCRICGLMAYNTCEGEPEDDQYEDDVAYHKNPSNARYCETCGRPTVFLTEGILKPWEQAKSELEDDDGTTNEVDFDDIPF